MEERLKKVIASVFEVNENTVTNKTKLKDLYTYDSLRLINFISALEEEFDLSIDYEDIKDLNSFDQIMAIVKKS